MPAAIGPFNGITWNWDDYDAVSNPYGLGNGGFREETGLPLLFASIEADVSVALQMSSTTSLAIGTGAKTFTPATMRGVPVGAYCWAINSASAWMWGQVTAKTATQITITVERTAGAGTLASWTLQPSGPQPPADTIDEGQAVLMAKAFSRYF